MFIDPSVPSHYDTLPVIPIFIAKHGFRKTISAAIIFVLFRQSLAFVFSFSLFASFPR